MLYRGDNKTKYTIPNEPTNDNYYSVQPSDIAKAILKKHPKVAENYNNGKVYGDFISCWESDIVFEVVMELTKRGIPCLTIYDSFIVQREYRETLQDFMNTAGFPKRLL